MKKSLMYILMIIIIIVSSFPAYAEFQEVLVVELEYSNGEISLKNLRFSSIYFHETKNQPEEGYNLVLTNQLDETLFQEKFEFLIYKYGANGAKPELGERKLFIPYTEDAKKIEIYSAEGSLFLEFDINESITNLKDSGNKSAADYYTYALLVLAIVFVIIVIIFLIRKKKNLSR